eukprot:TRINITY_DN15407_c0_g1_i3.p1 TRINITY_DN15407_c0_g1~~TRINITY_DN15407_c0_g1_i3.p1  ORF type:complete len:645 (+),score=130.80 TRINITY_DN15407_c0_g1_i3:104-1936(+)
MLDIGSGCGVMAIHAAICGVEHVVATDIVEAAPVCIQENAQRHGVSEKVEGRVSDVFSKIRPSEKFDVIFWNYPFVPDGTSRDYSELTDVERGIRDPGQDHLRTYCKEASNFLKPNGRLFVTFSQSMGDWAAFHGVMQETGWGAKVFADLSEDGPQVQLYELSRAAIASEISREGGKRVLVIAASPMGEHSVTNKVGQAFLDAHKKKFPNDVVETLELFKPDVLPHFSAARVQSKLGLFADDAAAGEQADKEWEETRQLIEQFKAADKYVFLTPMWNMWIPHKLKLYFDHIVQHGLTFQMSDGMPKGLVTGKPAIVIRSAGGVPVGSDMDTGYAYMKAILSFVGFTDVRLLGITGTANADGLAELLEKKSSEAAESATKFEFDAEAKLEAPTKAPEMPHSEPASIKEGSKVLYITASPMGEMSATKAACTQFLEVLKEKRKVEVTEVDLSEGKLEDFTAARVQAKCATVAAEVLKKEGAVSDALIDQLKAHDVYIFAVPMWNLSIPFTLKQWVDHIVQPHQTFDPSSFKGLLEGKRAFVVACSGSGLIGSPVDHLTPYMKQILEFVGVSDISLTAVKSAKETQEAVDVLAKFCCLSDDYISGRGLPCSLV